MVTWSTSRPKLEIKLDVYVVFPDDPILHFDTKNKIRSRKALHFIGQYDGAEFKGD